MNIRVCYEPDKRRSRGGIETINSTEGTRSGGHVLKKRWARLDRTLPKAARERDEVKTSARGTTHARRRPRADMRRAHLDRTLPEAEREREEGEKSAREKPPREEAAMC
jgi:hypothetical protein